jgi:predicted metal-dependent hydrolase
MAFSSLRKSKKKPPAPKRLSAELSGERVEIRLYQSRRTRHLRFTVSSGGRITLSAPRRTPLSLLLRFVEEKRAWLEARYQEMRALPHETRLSGPALEQAKAQALALVIGRLEHYNALYGFRYGRVTVRAQKTLWGSCSPQGNLSFNYRLVDLPEALSDYVVVHELCHLAELNHGKRFWSLVAKALPDYQERRRRLARHERGQ